MTQERGSTTLTFHLLEPPRWSDFEKLFGERGACGGCWCMLWRLPRSQFESQKGEKNRRAMKALVEAGETPGLIACAEGRPVGWCAVAPRESYPALQRSRVLKPVDDQPVWSIACLFVERSQRRRGISVELLRAAARHARSRGAKIVEGYPVEPREKRAPDVFVWTGLASAFRRAGFREVARRSPSRPIMRWSAEQASGRKRKSNPPRHPD